MTHDPPGSFALAGYPVHLADSQSARFSLGGISKLLAGKIQAGLGDASRWLKLFNVAYSEKLGMPVFPGSLNIALDHVFDWFDARYKAHTIWFDREEYGGERDILLLPCELVSLDRRRAFLWTPTTAARDRRDPWVVEIVADVNLRDHFGLQDGDVVEIRVRISNVQKRSARVRELSRLFARGDEHRTFVKQTLPPTAGGRTDA